MICLIKYKLALVWCWAINPPVFDALNIDFIKDSSHSSCSLPLIPKFVGKYAKVFKFWTLKLRVLAIKFVKNVDPDYGWQKTIIFFDSSFFALDLNKDKFKLYSNLSTKLSFSLVLLKEFDFKKESINSSDKNGWYSNKILLIA